MKQSILNDNLDLDFGQILQASKHISAKFIPTPVILLENIVCDGIKINVYGKFENVQIMNSFKVRGPEWFVKKLMDDHSLAQKRFSGIKLKKPTLYGASAGNHAQGFVLAGRNYGLDSVVYMPIGTSQVKMQRVIDLGGKIIIYGNKFDESLVKAQWDSSVDGLIFLWEAAGLSRTKTRNGKVSKLANEIMDIAHEMRQMVGKRAFVPPYEHKDIMTGQASVGIELMFPEYVGVKNNFPHFDVIFAGLGGGGLASGIGAVAQVYNSADVCGRGQTLVYGVQNENANGMYRSMKSGKACKSFNMHSKTIAEGIAVKVASEAMYGSVKTQVDRVLLVDEESVIKGIGYVGQHPRLKGKKLDWADYRETNFDVGGTVYSLNRIEGAAAAPYACAVLGDKFNELDWRKISEENACGRKELNVVCILSGGNIDPVKYDKIMAEVKRPSQVN